MGYTVPAGWPKCRIVFTGWSTTQGYKAVARIETSWTLLADKRLILGIYSLSGFREISRVRNMCLNLHDHSVSWRMSRPYYHLGACQVVENFTDFAIRDLTIWYRLVIRIPGYTVPYRSVVYFLTSYTNVLIFSISEFTFWTECGKPWYKPLCDIGYWVCLSIFHCKSL